MGYFNRKELLRVLAEKPDLMASFPDCLLNAQQRLEIEHIPEVVLCDVTMIENPAAIGSMLSTVRPQALLPAVVYGGAERMRWSGLDHTISNVKKITGRYLHVHVLPPIVLGAPSFRSALSMYAGTQTRQSSRDAFICAACLFYRAAVCIPLCKMCGINRIYFAGLAPCCDSAAGLLHDPCFLRYCSILPAGYGIVLDAAAPQTSGTALSTSCPDHVNATTFECCTRVPGNFSKLTLNEKQVAHYFETFAIPLAANVISGLLAGRVVDFIETARTFLPKTGDNKSAAC